MITIKVGTQAFCHAIAVVTALACAHLEAPRGTADRADRLCRAHHPEGLPEGAFWTDGCSAWPDGPWQVCCIEHDVAYWCGGSAEERAFADRALRSCVAERGFGMLGWLMWSGVRVGGLAVLPLPWRWGYGRPWPALYPSQPARRECGETPE